MQIFIYIISRCSLAANKYFTRLRGGSCIFIITLPLIININVALGLVELVLDCKPILHENYRLLFGGIVILTSLIIASFLNGNFNKLIEKYERENAFKQMKKHKLLIDMLLVLHSVLWIFMVIAIIIINTSKV